MDTLKQVREQRGGDCDLAALEDGSAGVGHDPGPDLDELELNVSQGPKWRGDVPRDPEKL